MDAMKALKDARAAVLDSDMTQLVARAWHEAGVPNENVLGTVLGCAIGYFLDLAPLETVVATIGDAFQHDDVAVGIGEEFDKLAERADDHEHFAITALGCATIYCLQAGVAPAALKKAYVQTARIIAAMVRDSGVHF